MLLLLLMMMMSLFCVCVCAGTNVQTNEEVAIKLVSTVHQLGFRLYFEFWVLLWLLLFIYLGFILTIFELWIIWNGFHSEVSFCSEFGLFLVCWGEVCVCVVKFGFGLLPPPPPFFFSGFLMSLVYASNSRCLWLYLHWDHCCFILFGTVTGWSLGGFS